MAPTQGEGGQWGPGGAQLDPQGQGLMGGFGGDGEPPTPGNGGPQVLEGTGMGTPPPPRVTGDPNSQRGQGTEMGTPLSLEPGGTPIP